MFVILPENSKAIAGSFDKSLKLMLLLQNPNIACIFKFVFDYLYRVSQQIKKIMFNEILLR